MRLKRFTFKLKPGTTLGQIWEAIREWIEGSPYSRFRGRRMLPTKISEGEAAWDAKDDRVTLNRIGEAMSVGSERMRRGLKWRTDLNFSRLPKCVRGVVEMHVFGSIPEGDIDVKKPIIVKRLCKTYGLAEEKSKSEGERPKPKAKRERKRLRAKVDDLKAHVTAEANRVIDALKGSSRTRDDVIAFVRSLYDKTNPKLSSWPKVVDYVRTLKDKDDPNFAECANVRALVQGFAKKKKNGIDAAWRSIAQEAKPSHSCKRKKANAAPGPVPILYKGSDFL